MTTPIQIGLPQILLFALFVLGVALFISSLLGLTRGKRELEIFEDDDGYQYRRWRRRRRQFRWRRGVSGVLVLIVAISLLWLTFSIQSYLGLTSDIKVATVQATQISDTNSNQPQMAVRLTLLDSSGKPLAPKEYVMNGDRWIIMGNMVKFPTWMNIFGIHSGYKLTRLEGMYSDPTLEANDKHTVVTLNGGDDNFFKSVYKQAWTSPFVDAAYGSATFEPADDQTYDIYTSQTGFYAKPANK
jgi:hypothetical protein